MRTVHPSRSIAATPPAPASDIQGLFSSFAGNPDDYHEIVRYQRAVEALARWTLLATLDICRARLPAVIPAAVQAAITPSLQPGVPAATAHTQHALVPPDPSALSGWSALAAGSRPVLDAPDRTRVTVTDVAPAPLLHTAAFPRKNVLL